jgi:uncharacterized protein YndB with AHSA1/START domain
MPLCLSWSLEEPGRNQGSKTPAWVIHPGIPAGDKNETPRILWASSRPNQPLASSAWRIAIPAVPLGDESVTLFRRRSRRSNLLSKMNLKLTDITVSQTILASAEKVFDVWIDPKSPGGPWFGAERVILNPVVDGLFYFAVRHEGKMWPHYGRFLQIDRPRRVEYTWVSEGTKGVESIVLVTLEARGEQTELTLRHSGVPDDEMGRQHKEGWTWVLSTLAERFARPSPSS